MNAENREAAESAVERFQETYGATYPKAAEKLLKESVKLCGATCGWGGPKAMTDRGSTVMRPCSALLPA